MARASLPGPYDGMTMNDGKAPQPNPIRDSKNRIKLGVFATNGNGAAFTFHLDRFKCTWDANVRLAQKAEKLGFEAFVSAAHWKSFGGDDHYSGDLMETFTWAGAVAAVTERIGIISTVHVTVNHPVFVAKAEATVDLVSNGRAGMNLVLGWYPPDMQLFGYEVKEHSDRFELAEEWIHIFDRLWSERKSFDYNGTNYNLKAAYSQPHGVQARPVLLNAGRSPRGREFAAKHCDIAFVSAHNPAPAAIKQQVEDYRNEARTSKYGCLRTSCCVTQSRKLRPTPTTTSSRKVTTHRSRTSSRIMQSTPKRCRRKRLRNSLTP
jgi:dimethylsulfone monooxygenase